MGTSRDQIEKGEIRKYFTKPRAGVHKWMKRQMNRLIRRHEDEMPVRGRFRPTSGWEY